MSFISSVDDFNPRLREGGDDGITDDTEAIKISIHASAREATEYRPVSGFLHHHFNPRLREGGDDLISYIVNGESLISIHASAREATSVVGTLNFIPVISIHASAREATEVDNMTYGQISNFNPRLREGGDCSFKLN